MAGCKKYAALASNGFAKPVVKNTTAYANEPPQILGSCIAIAHATNVVMKHVGFSIAQGSQMASSTPLQSNGFMRTRTRMTGCCRIISDQNAQQG